jgi:AbrB family looped-hinge helix DNA binding protein
MQTTLTSKGQVTVLAVIREKINLQTGDKLDFEIENGAIRVVQPTTDSPRRNSTSSSTTTSNTGWTWAAAAARWRRLAMSEERESPKN